MSVEVVPASVAICTIGRPALLRGCLQTLALCRPRAAEVLIVDQSDDDQVIDVVAEFASIGARRLACSGKGVALGRNLALQATKYETVLLTDDDCTVDTSWVARAFRHVQANPDAIVTGRVLPGGDGAVPSTIASEAARSYTGPRVFAMLHTGNMAARRDEVLSIGGFDERIRPAASDNDLCYRWLKAGRLVRYEPDLVVWHHDWRTTAELERRYVDYAVGQGMFYAKHLRRGDREIARRLIGYLQHGCRGTAARILRGRPPEPDWRQGILRGLPVGLVRGWRVFKEP